MNLGFSFRTCSQYPRLGPAPQSCEPGFFQGEFIVGAQSVVCAKRKKRKLVSGILYEQSFSRAAASVQRVANLGLGLQVCWRAGVSNEAVIPSKAARLHQSQPIQFFVQLRTSQVIVSIRIAGILLDQLPVIDNGLIVFQVVKMIIATLAIISSGRQGR